MKILIVDDSEYARKTLSDRVKHFGHEVIECDDGDVAIQKSKEEQPDIIFMDVVMPKMDGITAIKHIKNQVVDTKIIVCSSMSNKKVIMEAIFAGAYTYLYKPLHTSQLDKILDPFYVDDSAEIHSYTINNL